MVNVRIVAYLPLAGALETQKPRKVRNNRRTSVCCSLLGNMQRKIEFAAFNAATIAVQ
jgi:hypothetical protein